jgi:hypothetical protein
MKYHKKVKATRETQVYSTSVQSVAIPTELSQLPLDSVVRWKSTEVSEEHVTSIFRVEDRAKK